MNPPTATQRIKNHLTYKLGLALIEFDKARKAKRIKNKENKIQMLAHSFTTLGGGIEYLTLLIQLFNIKRNHKIQQQIYQHTITLFPSLKYPPLESCPDYPFAFLTKHHLAYKLGAVLIQCDRQKYQGGYLSLFKKINQAKKEYQITQSLKQILEDFSLPINTSTLKLYETLFDYALSFPYKFENLKTLLYDMNSLGFDIVLLLSKSSNITLLFDLKLKEALKSLLDDFNDYEALITSLKQAFAYDLHFITENLNIIKVWLYSKEFKQNYQDKNHPYPSLLNPNKIDYNTIPAELAWEMNLSLKQCDMVCFASHGVGGIFALFMNQLNIKSIPFTKKDKQGCISVYNALNASGAKMLWTNDYSPMSKKLYALIPSPKIKTLNRVRDPISTLKHYMSMKRSKTKNNKIINLTYNTKEYLANQIGYSAIGGLKSYPSLENIEGWINFRYMCFHDTLLYNALININEVEFMDMSEIVGKRTFETMKRFAKEFNVAEPKESDREFFERKSSDFALLLPTLYIHNDDLEKINTNDNSSLSKEDGIHLYLLKKFFIEENIHKDITNELLSQDFIFKIDIIRVVIKCEDEEKYKELKANTKLLKRTKAFVKELIENILEQEKIENAKKLTENDVLDYLRKDERLRKKFKKILDEEHLVLIKERRPDIVASWKYYKEFERMCEEMDK